MRRSVGVARSTANQRAASAFQAKGDELQESAVEHAKRSVEQFRTHLEAFAVKHKKQINNDHEFRNAFATMCASIGVDPLASQKGFWAELLGVGDFYFELGVQIITVAMASKPINGGLMSIDDVLERLEKIRKARGINKQKQSTVVSRDDVLQAIAKVAVLGNGFQVSRIGDRDFLVAVPLELSSDQTRVLELAKAGRVLPADVRASEGWALERVERALAALAASGMAWLDRVDGSYWFPSLLDLEGVP